MTRPPPFRGLAPFTESREDAELFFGREAEIEIAAANLLAARLTLLYGPSGVGKTSLLRAGLVRRLRTEDRVSAHHAVVLLSEWTGDPVAELIARARRATRSDPGDHGAGQIEEALPALAREHGVELLVILDQFEEYLNRYPAGGPLDDALPQLVSGPGANVRLMISLREDALAGLDRFKGTIPDLFGNYLRLDRLDPEMALEAIERPLEGYNRDAERPVGLEPGLAAEVVRQLGDPEVGLVRRHGPSTHRSGREAPVPARIEPAFLQLVLTRLWEADAAREPPVLSRATLDARGGAGRILQTHLRTGMDALPAEDQRLAYELLHLLVTPSGMKVRHTPSDLAEYAGADSGDVQRTLGELADARHRVLRAVPPPPGVEDPLAYELFHDVLAGAVLDWRTEYQAAQRRGVESRNRRLRAALIVVSAFAIALTVHLWNPETVRRLELQTVDTRFAVRGSRGSPGDAALVAVDDRTLSALGGREQLLRSQYARLIERVNEDRPRVIAVAVHFTEPKTPAGDARLLRAVMAARARLVLSFEAFQTRIVDARPIPNFLGRRAVVDGLRLGYSGLSADPGSVVRRLDYSVDATLSREAVGMPKPNDVNFPTLAVEAAKLATGDRLRPERLPEAPRRAWGDQTGRTAWIDYPGGAGTVREVSAIDLLEGRVPPGALRDKVVVIGRTARSQEDLIQTSFPGGPIPGPELQADAIETVLRGIPLRDVPVWVEGLIILALASVASVAAMLLRPPWLAAAAVPAAAVVLVGGAQLAFQAGRVVSLTVPLLALGLGAAGEIIITLIRTVTARRRRRAAHRASSRPRPAEVR